MENRIEKILIEQPLLKGYITVGDINRKLKQKKINSNDKKYKEFMIKYLGTTDLLKSSADQLKMFYHQLSAFNILN
jgi:hypothetical protein